MKQTQAMGAGAICRYIGAMSGIPSFVRHGPASPAGPVIVSVPHAGRDYPPAMRAALRVGTAALAGLEDRHVDAVALAAAGRGDTMFVQRIARAWIDLNRSEDERDAKVDAGAPPSPTPSARLRSGLGLVPGRAPGVGDIWSRRLSAEEVDARITAAHRPYHAALADALAAAHARFGVAVLLDLHSMPPLGRGRARIVLGDRFGHAAAARYVHRLEGEVQAAGLSVALNAPYAGGHVLERHADSARGIHAVQVELDRALYLDTRLDTPGAGLAATAQLVRGLIDALADEALSGSALLAAE